MAETELLHKIGRIGWTAAKTRSRVREVSDEELIQVFASLLSRYDSAWNWDPAECERPVNCRRIVRYMQLLELGHLLRSGADISPTSSRVTRALAALVDKLEARHGASLFQRPRSTYAARNSLSASARTPAKKVASTNKENASTAPSSPSPSVASPRRSSRVRTPSKKLTAASAPATPRAAPPPLPPSADNPFASRSTLMRTPPRDRRSTMSSLSNKGATALEDTIIATTEPVGTPEINPFIPRTKVERTPPTAASTAPVRPVPAPRPDSRQVPSNPALATTTPRPVPRPRPVHTPTALAAQPPVATVVPDHTTASPNSPYRHDEDNDDEDLTTTEFDFACETEMVQDMDLPEACSNELDLQPAQQEEEEGNYLDDENDDESDVVVPQGEENEEEEKEEEAERSCAATVPSPSCAASAPSPLRETPQPPTLATAPRTPRVDDMVVPALATRLSLAPRTTIATTTTTTADPPVVPVDVIVAATLPPTATVEDIAIVRERQAQRTLETLRAKVKRTERQLTTARDHESQLEEQRSRVNRELAEQYAERARLTQLVGSAEIDALDGAQLEKQQSALIAQIEQARLQIETHARSAKAERARLDAKLQALRAAPESSRANSTTSGGTGGVDERVRVLEAERERVKTTVQTLLSCIEERRDENEQMRRDCARLNRTVTKTHERAGRNDVSAATEDRAAARLLNRAQLYVERYRLMSEAKESTAQLEAMLL